MSAVRRLLAAMGTLVVALAVALLPALPAAAVPTAIAWVTTGPVQSAYGGDWFAQLRTSLNGASTPIPATLGTVDVFASGIAAPIAVDLPIQPDGSVYVASSVEAPLPAGSYELTAIFEPAAGTGLVTSQTSSPLALEVASFAIDARARVEQSGESSTVELTLTGEYLDSTGGVPAGTWTLRVLDGDDVAVERAVAQPGGKAAPVRYPLSGDDLEAGRQYTVEAEFTPVASIADGLEVTQPEAQTFTQGGGTGLTADIPYPWWALVLTILVPLGLAIAVIVLALRAGRTPARPLDAEEPAEA